MSKRSEALTALRKMSDAELAGHVRDQRRKTFEVRFQQVTGQVENQRQLRQIRKEIARAMTVRVQAQAAAAAETEPAEVTAGEQQ